MLASVAKWDEAMAMRRLNARRWLRATAWLLLVTVGVSVGWDHWLPRSPEDDWERFDGNTMQITWVVSAEEIAIKTADEETLVRLLGGESRGMWDQRVRTTVNRLMRGKEVVLHLAEGQTRDARGRLMANGVMPDGRRLLDVIADAERTARAGK